MQFGFSSKISLVMVQNTFSGTFQLMYDGIENDKDAKELTKNNAWVLGGPLALIASLALS